MARPLAITEQLKKLANAWAQANGVPSSAVGFDDANGREIDLQKTPQSLGWAPGQQIILVAFPTEESFMEQATEVPERAPEPRIAGTMAAAASVAAASAVP